jgi:hypothetical protein
MSSWTKERKNIDIENRILKQPTCENLFIVTCLHVNFVIMMCVECHNVMEIMMAIEKWWPSSFLLNVYKIVGYRW